MPSFGAQYVLTGRTNASALTILTNTAASLASRYSPIVGATQSWGVHPPPDHQFRVIVDNMMNLELLYFVGNVTGNQTLSTMASTHASTTQRTFFQPWTGNSCTWHMVVFNDTNGEIISRSSTPQGLGTDTVWSRGQGWAVNGFAISYRFTQLPAHLAQA